MTSQAAEPAPAVHLQAAALRYGGRSVFEALDLVLPAGRTTCLLGPSGVGKTSLLRLIAGLAQGASDHSVTNGVAGQVVDQSGRPLDGRIAYLAQQDLLLPWLSLRDNVTLGSRLRGEVMTSESDARAQALIAQVGLSGRVDDRPAQLSGGQRQRVALARTLMENRPIVLMDEPFSALDAITRYELQDLAAKLLAARTVLLVTHDPLEALRLGHRVLVMAGSPAQIDTPLEPAGGPPRHLDDPSLLALQAELLNRLTRAKTAGTELD